MLKGSQRSIHLCSVSFRSSLWLFDPSYTGIVIARFFLGLVEAPFFPGIIFLVSKWYKRNELALRILLVSCGSFLSAAFGSLLASAILHSMQDKLGQAAWRQVTIVSLSLLGAEWSVDGYFLLKVAWPSRSRFAQYLYSLISRTTQGGSLQRKEHLLYVALQKITMARLTSLGSRRPCKDYGMLCLTGRYGGLQLRPCSSLWGSLLLLTSLRCARH